MKHITQKKDELLNPVLTMIPAWITPNHLTVFRIVLAIPIILILFQGMLLLALILFLFGMTLDLIDGPLARMRGQTTEFGALFDPLADKALIGSIFFILGIFLIPFNLFATILIIELTTVVGSAVYVSLVHLKMHRHVRIASNDLGKYKMLLYAIGSCSLILGLYIPGLLTFSVLCFWFGVFFALASAIQFLFGLRKIKD